MGSNYNRLQILNEAHMLCEECGSKLYSFEGTKDKAKPCPYKRWNLNSKC